MKPWMKAAIFGSILMLCLFFYKMNEANKTVFYPLPEYTEPIPLPPVLIRKDIKREELIVNLAENEQPFRPLFFEKMVLKGIMKDGFGRWLAIFTDGTKENSSRLLKFAAGDTHNGITLVDVDNKGCLIKYGNIERRFEIQ